MAKKTSKPSNEKLAELFAELQRIEESRSLKAEKEIGKIYKGLLNDLQEFVGGEYAKYAEDDVLTYAMLQQKGQYARFLEEVRDKANGISPKIKKTITDTCEDIYKLAFDGMTNAVKLSANDKELSKILSGLKLTQPQVIKAATTNPIAKLTLSKTLEKHRKEIIYSINKTVTNGIMNGDRLTTMANRIKNEVGINYRKAMLVARTETHRVRETGHNDSAMEISNALEEADSEYRMVKIWRSMHDSKVRHTKLANHRKADGQVVLEDEEFELENGVKALCPGQSGTPYNDCNCRCYASHDLWSDEEFFQATGRHFPKKEAPKKQYETQKNLQKSIDKSEADLQEIYDKNNVTNLEELEKKPDAGFVDVDKAAYLEATIKEKEEKLQKKIVEAQTKQLKKQETAMQKQVDAFDIKTYSGIWKDDVTTKDWKYKKDSIPKKKDYFDDKLKYATTEAEKAKWQQLLDELDEFNVEGAAYNSLESQLIKTKADLTKLQKNGKIRSAAAEAFTQERKDAARWFDKQAGGFAEADKYFDPPALQVHASATKQERDGFYTYTQGSGGHNRPLAGFEKPWSLGGTGWEEKFYKGAKNVWIDYEGKGDQIRGLTSLIEKSVYPDDVWLQSGQNFASLEGFLNIPYGSVANMSDAELQQYVGRKNVIYNFISSAVNEGGGSIFNNKPMKFNIYAPSGSQMLYASDKGAFGKGENEMILQRGGTYEITRIYWDTDATDGGKKKLFVDMEIHPEEGYDLFQQDPNEWKGSKKKYRD